MVPNRPLSKVRSKARHGASGKFRKAGDGMIWSTEGLVFLSFAALEFGIQLVSLFISEVPKSARCENHRNLSFMA